MNKKVVLVILIVFVVAVGTIGWKLYGNQRQGLPSEQAPLFVESPGPNDFTASFEIYTNGTKRVFTAAMYHNQSSDVYIQNSNPSTVYVKKDGVTWKNFFDTLPFSLTKECLVTGTKQTFCNTETKRLRFFLNDTEVPEALDLKIQPGDFLRITFGS